MRPIEYSTQFFCQAYFLKEQLFISIYFLIDFINKNIRKKQQQKTSYFTNGTSRHICFFWYQRAYA